MAENQELQAKIAALAGRINVHKQRAENSQHQAPQQESTDPSERAHWAHRNGSSYGHNAHRVSKRAPPIHRHRTLVINRAGTSTSNTADQHPTSDGVIPTPESPLSKAAKSPSEVKWVSKRDRHMQLISAAVYDRVSQQRAQEIAKTTQERQVRRDALEKAKLSKYLQKASTQAPNAGHVMEKHKPRTFELSIDNIRFEVVDGGSKLIRISRESNMKDSFGFSSYSLDNESAIPTPKTAQVGGVTFYRGKDGNLYRAGLVKAKMSQQHISKVNEPCPRFTTTGLCLKGPNCRFNHDPNKVAICKDYLLKGVCPLDDCCDLSHDPTPHRVPACVHFLRGNCTNHDCRYAHVRVNPGAAVCNTFARLGYCEKGLECTERHVFECPDYANQGFCRVPHCRLPHVDRAGQIRKSTSGEASKESQGSSDDNTDEDLDFDMDAEAADQDSEHVLMQDPEANGHELSQQHDFIRF